VKLLGSGVQQWCSQDSMPGITDRKLVQEQASLAGFRLEDKSVKLLLQWLANGANEEELQQLFSIVDTGGLRNRK
jgi:hypothetical protein